MGTIKISVVVIRGWFVGEQGWDNRKNMEDFHGSGTTVNNLRYYKFGHMSLNTCPHPQYAQHREGTVTCNRDFGQ